MVSKSISASVSALCSFVSPNQLTALIRNCQGEEGAFFVSKLSEMAALVTTMPKTYEQEDKGDEAIAYLHYFVGGCDWYITEKDKGDGSLDTRQHQAFGLADLGYGAELGYISIPKIMQSDAEIDLYFKPDTLANIKYKLETASAMSNVNYVGHPIHY